MANDSGRGEPGPTATAEPAKAESSLTAEQEFNAKVAAARTPAEIAALTSAATPKMRASLDGKAAKPEAAKPPVEKPAEAEPEAAVEETPAAEETPAEAEPAAEEGDEEPEETDGDGPVEPVTGKRAHLRLAQDDRVGRLAASLMKRNRDLPMDEAVEKAKAQLGIKPKASEATPAKEAPKSDLPETVEAVDAEIRRLRTERKKANTELKFEDASDMSDKLDDLLQHRFNLERQGERKQAAEATAYTDAFAKSQAKAVELYAFAGDPESAAFKRAAEIDRDLKANGDPLYDSPDKPLRVAQMVAAELAIAPRKKGATTPPAKPPATPPPKKQVLPGPESRTAAPPVNQKPAIDAEIGAIRSVDDLRKMRQKLGLQI